MKMENSWASLYKSGVHRPDDLQSDDKPSIKRSMFVLVHTLAGE